MCAVLPARAATAVLPCAAWPCMRLLVGSTLTQVLHLQLYNYNCRRAHGPHVLACVPPTGHHTVGLVTACLPGYFIKHPRGKPACCASPAPFQTLSSTPLTRNLY